jgi:hypothetical protein
MHEALMAFCRWLESSPWGASTRTTSWFYPFIQLTHFTGLSLWLSTNVALDLRLMGIGSWRRTAAELSQDLFVWNWIGFCIVVTGGFILFSASATTYIINPAFLVKLGMLVPTALLFHVIVQWRSRRWGRTPELPGAARLAGLVELLLWLAVVTAAVEIPSY